MMKTFARGFSILEAIISVVMVGGLVLGLAHWMDSAASSVTNNIQNESVLAILDGVNMALGKDDAHCGYALNGTLLNASQSSSTPIPKIDFYDDKGKSLGTLLKVSQPIAQTGVIMESLALMPVAPLTAQIIVADLQFVFSKSSMSSKTLTVRHLPIYTRVSGGKVQACSTTPIPTDVVNARICDIMNDGYSFWNPATQSCQDDPRVKWVNGTSSASAACPEGYMVAANPNDPQASALVCSATNALSGSPPPPRNYSNGLVLKEDGNIAVPILNTATNTCTFVYATTANMGTVHTSIKCVPAGAPGVNTASNNQGSDAN